MDNQAIEARSRPLVTAPVRARAVKEPGGGRRSRADPAVIVAEANRLLAAVNTAAIPAVLALDEAHGHLVNARAVVAAPPSERWYRLLDQFTSKAAEPESAPTVPPKEVGEHADRFACSLLVAAAAFLAAEANDLEDRIELLPNERQQEGIHALLNDIVAKVGDDADTLIGRVEDGTWQEFLDADRAAFAQRWAEVITSTSHTSMGADELVKYLLGLTHQLVEATLATEFDPSVVRRIGVNMVGSHFTGTETLSETLALIVQRLPDLLDHAPRDVDVASRVARLTGHMATGYASALRERRRDTAAIPRTTTTISYTPDSTTDLLSRVRDGELAPWEEILHRYGKLVSTTVQSFRLQEADALDAIQMTWQRLAENPHLVQFPERLGGWLATTARLECLRILRHQRRCTQTPTEMAVTEGHPPGRPEQRDIDADTAQTLWNLVAQSSPRRQTLLRALFTGPPRPYSEIGRAAGIPPGGIGPTRARALQQLRDKLNEHELGLGDAY